MTIIKGFVDDVKAIEQVPNDFADGVEFVLEQFNNRFRTAEVHGSGVFRKWSFLIVPRNTESDYHELSLFVGNLNFAFMWVSNAIIQGTIIPAPSHEIGKGYFWVTREEFSKDSSSTSSKS